MRQAETESNNPLDPFDHLDSHASEKNTAHPPQQILQADSAVTEAEKVERNGALLGVEEERPSKRAKLEDQPNGSLPPRPTGRVKGVAPIKPEYLIDTSASRQAKLAEAYPDVKRSQDDAEEARGKTDQKWQRKKKAQGQNKQRVYGLAKDAFKLCTTRANANEFDPVACRFGDACKFEHDLRKYLEDGKRADLNTFAGRCPVFDARASCSNGWKCRFVGAHSQEVLREDGRKELVLLGAAKADAIDGDEENHDAVPGVVNAITIGDRISLSRRKFSTSKSEPYTEWLNEMGRESEKGHKTDLQDPAEGSTEDGAAGQDTKSNGTQDYRASYTEPRFLPSEKRRIYYGPETPVLAPLTTQGNLPFRRLCVDLGAQITWSEMAMGLPLVQGEKTEWALMKAHASETTPPRYQPKVPVFDYDSSKDSKFGAQIAGNKPWLALKTTEILTSICPSLRAIDLNCGCPIDLVYRQGAGSALLDSPGKLEKILRGMNAVSGEVPITVKIRTGTRDNKPTASNLVSRLAFGGTDAHDYGLGPCGVAAVTLHGRSRQQRYTRSADWEYISKCATIVKEYNTERDSLTDTIHEPDARYAANTKDPGCLYFIGNGDCYSHEDYQTHIANANVDSVMVARGALIKPWIFEEVDAGQHLDKSATERLAYVEKFVRFGLETWGSDEIGIGTTRRFLLEWLSFACRYVPVGLLEYLPPNIQDRPPAFRGRDELETLLSSDNYRDWIKISEMFLGKPHDNFHFLPKHKSNSYDVEAEG